MIERFWFTVYKRLYSLFPYSHTTFLDDQQVNLLRTAYYYNFVFFDESAVEYFTEWILTDGVKAVDVEARWASVSYMDLFQTVVWAVG